MVLLSNSNVAFTKFKAYSKILGVVAIQQIQITYCDCDQAFSVYTRNQPQIDVDEGYGGRGGHI